MAVCWLSARTCNLFPSSFVGARHVVPVRDPFVEAGRNSSRPGRDPGASFSLATAFRFLVTRHCSSHSMVGDVAEGPPPVRMLKSDLRRKGDSAP